MLNWIWIKFIKLGFHLLYHQLAWIYDAVSWLVSFGAWREWQKAAIPYIKGNEVLEIAHGPGHMLVELRQRGYKVSGIDISAQMGRLARKRLGQLNLDVPLVQAAAEALSFPMNSFDSILATFPTDFITKKETLSSIWQTLKPEGELVIVPQAELTGTGILARIVEWLYAVTGQRNIPDQNQQQIFLKQMQNHFLESGFDLKSEKVTLAQSHVTVLIARRISRP